MTMIKTSIEIQPVDITALYDVPAVYGDAVMVLCQNNNAPLALALIAKVVGRSVITMPIPGKWAMYIDTPHPEESTLCLIQSRWGEGGNIERILIDKPANIVNVSYHNVW